MNDRRFASQVLSLVLVYALLIQFVPRTLAQQPGPAKPIPVTTKASSETLQSILGLSSLFSRARGALGALFAPEPVSPEALPVPTPTPANGIGIVRHAPSLNGNGRVEGSLRQLTGESVTLNGGGVITNDLQVPGTPTLLLNGTPTFGGTIQGTGSAQPTNYQVTLNGTSTTVLGHLVTRTDPISLTNVAAPPASTGTRSVTITAAGQSAGNFATLRDLTLNGNVGMYSIPPGTYRNFIANAGSGFILGVSGATQPSTYNMSTLTLNGSAQFQVIGPVILTLGNALTVNAAMGSSSNPAWLNLQLASGGLTLNSSSLLNAVVKAPASTVIINASSQLIGTLTCDRLTINGGGLLRLTENALPPVNQAPVANAGGNKTITLPSTASLNGSATDDGLPVGSTLTTSWTKVSGPGTVTFANANSAVATATFSQAGSYVVRLTASDSQLTNSSDATITVQPQNFAPAVSAGPDRTITQPGSATLNGSASDDGLPAGSSLSLLWTKVSGPGTVTFTSSTTAVTNATFSAAGSYTLRLTASDSQLSNYDEVLVTANPQNQAPNVNAGADQSITLPASVSLHGTVTDDGLPAGSSVSVAWTKLSGPGTVTFSSPNNANTNASFSVAGNYTLQLTAGDSVLSNHDEVLIQVAPQNFAPQVNAGANQTITLPASANLNGSVSDDGLPANSVVTTAWSQVSGPGTVTFGSPNVTVTTATFSEAGSYVLRLTASDSELSNHADVTITVIAENHAPSVDAGTSQTITLPNAASLNGAVIDDGLPAGSTLTSVWTKSSGPGTVSFANASSPVTSASFSVSGTYELRLTASDSELSTYSNVVITVIAQNHAPTANAGADQTITLPATANMNGSASDDGLPAGSTLTTVWSKASGPGTVSFGNPNVTVTTAAFSEAGTYVLRLTASDSDLSNSDEVQIVVVAENHAPTVSAGADQTITQPATANLNGSASDDGLPAGSTLTTVWSKVSGPGTVSFGNPNVTVTTAAFSEAGTYMLRLTASDSDLSNSDEVQIVVIAENHAPTANAGADQTITLPAAANLNGSTSDDGLPTNTLTTVWSKVSGPGTVTFGDPAVTVTTAAFSEAGTYVLRLTASDSDLSASDEVEIIASSVANEAPTVNAGSDQSISTCSALLQGTATDDGQPAGSMLTYAWTKVSGPGDVTFSAADSLSSAAAFSVTGNYVLRLTVSDTSLSTADDVAVNVGAAVTPQAAHYFSPTPYLKAEDSPFRAFSFSRFYLEDFEDHQLNTPGASSQVGGTTATIFGPEAHDSVDADDGVIDGNGLAGDCYYAFNGNAGIKFDFDANVLGGLPTYAGLVWTDGAGVVYFEAFDRNGVSMGLQGPYDLADSAYFGATAEDRFLGAHNPDGISAIRVLNTQGGCEADHLQYGFEGNAAPAVNAGADQTIFLPALTASLNGSVADDGQPGCGAMTSLWSVVSGPGSVTFANANSPVTTATFSVAGTYVLRLTANDSQLNASDDVTINITSNHPPVASFDKLDTSGRVQLGVVRFSSYNGDASVHPNQLIDNSPYTFWQAATGQITNQYVVFNTTSGNVEAIDRVILEPWYYGYYEGNVRDFEVQISSTTSDDAAFTTVLSATMPPNNNLKQEFSLPGGTVLARFIKLLVKNNYGQPNYLNLASFQVASTGKADSIISFLGLPNSAHNQSPALPENGGVIYETSYSGGTTTADTMLGYYRGGWIAPKAPDQFATVQLGGDKVYTIAGVKLATWYDWGYGYGTAAKDFEVWVSSTTPDAGAFTKVLTGTIVFDPRIQTFTFPGGPVSAKYVKYVPLSNWGGAAQINTQMFDVVGSGYARVIASSGEYEYYPYPAEQAFDDNQNTSWYSPNNVSTDVWVKVALENETIHQVYGVRINPNNSWYGTNGPKDFDIRVSTTTIDDSSFTTAYSGTASAALFSGPQEFRFPAPVAAKYVQFYWKNGYSSANIGVLDLGVIANSSTGSTIVGYSSAAADYQGPMNALDIDPTNYPWVTANGQNTNQWLKLALPNSSLWNINHVSLMPGQVYPDPYMAAKDFEVQISTTDDSDASFSTVFSGTLVNTVTLQHFRFPTVQARFVKLLLKNNYGSGSLGLHGFYVYSADHGSTDAVFLDHSTDSDGQVVTWAWDLGDGATSSEPNPVHHYAAPGTYTVSLTVTDNGGLSDSYQFVYQASAPLVADFAFSPIRPHEGGETLRVTDVTRLLVHANSSRYFDFGNGNTVPNLYSTTYPYQYSDSGTLTFTMKLGDSSLIQYVVTKPITVVNMPPVVSVQAGKTVVWGEQWTNTPQMSDQSSVDSQTLHGVWEFGDGQTADCINCNNSTGTITHSYSFPGAYAAKFTVTDKDNGAGSAIATYTVNKRPTAFIFQSPPAQTNGNPLVIHAQLMDTFGNLPLAGKPVELILNGVSYSAVTGAGGVAEVSVPLPAGTKIDSVIGNFAGDDMYATCSGVGVPVTAGGTPPSGTPSNAGTNFWLMFPQSYQGSQYVFISSPVATSGTVTIPSLNFSTNFNVLANTALRVSLPWTETYESDVVTNHGVHVTSQSPVTVYGMNQRFATSDAYLGLPVPALGEDYYILTYSNMEFAPSSELGVVATEDNTTLSITPAVTTGVRLAGVPYNIVLNQGQTYLLQNTVPTTAGDLSGSRVTSDKPVAVFGAHMAATIPAEVICCADHLVEQMPPVDTWGKRFATIPLATRAKGDFFRFIAARDNTTIYINGRASAVLNQGQWVERIIKEPAEIIATEPIMVVQLATSIFFDVPSTGKADPLMMVIPPYSQFLNHYTISTPPTGFQINYANVVAPTAMLGSITIDGSTLPTGGFTPIGASGYSGAQIPIGPGSHTLDGPGSFGIFVYGFAQDEGYGYPGGMNLAPTVQATNVVVAPETSVRPVNSQACVVATVTNQDQLPLGGRSINFAVTGANSSNSSATTDAAGRAQFCYTGGNLGSDLVTASFNGASGTASVQWLTDVANQAPAVNAGADQTISLPAPATLQGSASDDGLPSYTLNASWSKVSGPGNVVFANPTLAATTATFAAAGTYVLRLTASDTALSMSDDVQITVNPTPTNQPPTANAGSDLSAAIKGNLIVNPGNEQPLVNGEIPGWVEEQGTTWTQGNSSIEGLPDPHRGQHFFYVGADSAQYAELRQDVDVSAFATAINAGTQQFEYQTWVRAASEFPYPDQPRIIVEFRNALNNGILGSMEGGNSYAINNWYLTETVQTAPLGTAWIRVRLIATRNSNLNNDAYFDSISLRPAGNTAVKLNGTVTDDTLPYGSSVSTNWSAVSGPAPVTFTNTSSAGSAALFTTPGIYVLRLTGSDGQDSASDDVSVTISPQNQPPVVSGSTNQSITLPQTAPLSGIVNDDGLPVGSTVSTRWRKDQGPGTVTFADAKAANTTASFSTPGFYVLIFTADDSEFSASTPFYVSVNQANEPTNQPPVVNPGSNQTIYLPTNTVTLNGTATDDGLPTGSTLTVNWTKVSGPGNVIFGNANSAVTTAQFSAEGSYVLRLSASDGAYLVSADVGVILNPEPLQNQAPTANAGPDQTALISQGAQLDGSASDDGLPAGNLTTTWTKLSGPGDVTFLNPNVTITGAQFSATGIYVLRLTASDAALSASDDVSVTVIEPVAPPTVEITAPADQASITELSIVTGSVSSGDWVVEYSLASDDNVANRVWTTFGSGSGAITGTLGTLDPTMMLNGLFAIRLSATDSYGQTSRTSTNVIVEGSLKLGNFNISFTDLAVPVAGVPMEVTRAYDTRDKRTGDFGVGWSLGLNNIRLEKANVIGLKWYETRANDFAGTYCLEPTGSHLVSVTFPGGKVFKFEAATSPHCQGFAEISGGALSFTPLPGTKGTLEIVGSPDFVVEGSKPGPVNLISINGGIDIFNSSLFKFTAEDGTAYVIDQRTGLQSIQDRNNNTVTITAGGIVHSNGKSITFTRDGLGRITTITDPAGHVQTYTYDAAGDLVSYKDAENNTSTYTYDTTHRLLTIQDPRGVQPMRNDYDSTGRLISHTDGFGKVITYTHDLVNRIETVTDRLGHSTTYECDGRGNVLRRTDAHSGVSTFTYDSHDNVLTETNALGKTTTNTYDSNDHRTSITDPLGHVTQFTYNALGKMLTTTDPLNQVTTNAYSPAGKLLTATDALNNTTSFIYSIFDGQVISTTSASNATTHYDYFGGYLTKQTDPLGHVTTFTYDANANRASETVTRTNSQGQAESLTISFEYDQLNRLKKTTYPDGSFTQIEYNSIGQQSASVDQLGRRTESIYDDMGRPTRTNYSDGTHEESTYDAEGHKLTGTDRGGHVTSYAYDELGLLTKTTFADGTFTRSTYDAIGRTATVTDARGNTTHFEYDDAGRRTKVRNALNQEVSFTYDDRGNQRSMTDALGHTTTYEYTVTNQRNKVIYADSSFETFNYDALGRKVSATDQAGKTTQFTYDDMGRLTKVKDALNQETSYGYNEVDQQVSQTDANNHVTRFEYDQVGRRLKRILPGGQFETCSYDNNSNLLSRTDFNGKTTSFTYDSMGRLLTKTPDASLGQAPISWTYNGVGQRATMADASGVTTYGYDARNRLTSKQTPFGTLTYTYDPAGNLATTRSSNANGVSVDYGYDVLNRLTTAKDNHVIGLNGGVSNYNYDAVGNLQSYQYPNAATSTYAYNSLNRLTGMGVSTPMSALAGYSYTLGPSGNRTAATELNGRTVSYTYDDLYRLTKESVTNDSHGIDGAAAYGYDPVGNRLSLSSSITPVPSQNSSYDTNDRLTNHGYDSNGNTLAANGNSYGYDFENHLTSFNGGSVNYVYDGDGNRVAKTVAGITTNYLVDTNNPSGYPQVVEELQGGSVIKSFTYGHDLISQRIVGSTLSFYGYDGSGSVRLLTDENGAITDTYDYDAFGVLVYRSGTTPNDYLYRGEQFDANLGVYYLRARYMDASTGRFLSMDSFEGENSDPLSLHKYVYANNDPVNRLDPSGNTSYGEMAVTIAINGIINAIAFGSISYIFNRLRGVNHETAFREAVKAGGIGFLLAIPYLGTAIGIYFTLGFIRAAYDGELSNLDYWEFATYLVVGLALKGITTPQAKVAIDSRPLLPAGSEPPTPQPARVFRSLENGVCFPEGVQGTSPQVGDFTGLRGADPLTVLERIPADWTADATRGEGGALFSHPTNGTFEWIRVMPGNPNSPYINSRGSYLRIFKNQYLDDVGNTTTKTASEGHIPLKGNPGAQ